MQETVAAGNGEIREDERPVYVFELPLRLWHWIHAFSVVTLATTGYFIANPLPSLAGEASDHFVMGTIRMIHFIAAYVFAIGFLVRIYWAFAGNKYAHQLFVLPLWRKRWWKSFFYDLRFYLFFENTMRKELGHDPLAQSTMFLFNVLGTTFMILTGFALYSEGLGSGSWADGLFGWVIPVMGGSEATHNWHNVGMWIMVTFMIIHIYTAIRADIMSRESVISTIVSGWRYWKEDPK